MINSVQKYLNKDLIYTGLNQLWRLVSGPLMLILIPLYLTAEEQGYWYTFVSLAALAIFADLGFSIIILQFSAHEFAFLRFNQKGEFEGDSVHLNKIAKLFTFTVKRVILVSLATFPIILCIGYFMLSQKFTILSWHLPWLIYGISSAIGFINSTILYFFEGCNSVAKVQNIRLKMSIFTSTTVLIGLIFKLKLYALSISLLVNAIIGMYFIYHHFKAVIIQLIEVSKTCEYSWSKDILSLIWKYAISWACGYFMFQMYTPLTFHFHGAIEAGKVGLSITLWMAVFGISNVWIGAITPKLNMYISKQDWSDLDKVFRRNLLLAGITFLLGAVSIWGLTYFLKGKIFIFERFVNDFSMAILGICWFCQLIINTLAVYLRAHKEEPLLIPSFVSAVYISLSTWLCAKYLSVNYLFLGYLSSYAFMLPWVIHIFYKWRRKHYE